MSERKPRTGPLTFLKQVRAEGNKVTWTTRQETQAATIMVLIMVVIAATFLFLVDLVWGAIIPMITGI
ncbi:preprotein translocase subunit SecE [Ponticaulis sp.]|uniref:preprotein translocase subunit SecE n=1 Tax=Ponticaulis sp. TaxID=2020902 RepID=UPI000B6C4B83|nr:preprotein translocase subunit SecE [Ponticaulis sp.]MAI91991.1 preprotein translocase subunit SecE [Ponticaulis sp.]OUX96458.1 MAG: preprotein translocase subunit SecE [Hyphomonadaceae bacterium TMED5]|tara:strand:+ start:74413 stop:74616 length:204 start_codon:yes stop_codon:yes gene_type:complete